MITPKIFNLGRFSICTAEVRYTMMILVNQRPPHTVASVAPQGRFHLLSFCFLRFILSLRKLNAQKNVFPVKVVRDGYQSVVQNTDLVVGDILLIEQGDKVPADGILAATDTPDVVLDESSLTGESEGVRKRADRDPFCRCGTQVTSERGTDMSRNACMICVVPEFRPYPLLPGWSCLMCI